MFYTVTDTCCLEYCITLLKIVEPLEERMEQALFSPPLSKQRVEYALRHIKESQATSLVRNKVNKFLEVLVSEFVLGIIILSIIVFVQVDFGCGSGSLLESLLDYFTSLETIVGVDISHKSLARAAKVRMVMQLNIIMSKTMQSLEWRISLQSNELYSINIMTVKYGSESSK